MLDYRDFSLKLINWYHINKRELPWRKTSDPYKIWLSEVMLQQTRVNQGLPYYLKFLEAFPEVTDMANAPEDRILRLWQGLGYYSRAKNLHKCAQTIVEAYGGQFPEAYKELLKLPGIGPYTAAAISSIAFNKPHAVVDGNVQRVLSRYLGIGTNIADPSTIRQFHSALEKFIDRARPGLFNQSIMELGALVCTPKSPGCQACPIAESCFANVHKKQKELPFKLKKLKRKNRYFYYWVLMHNDKIALRKRDANNIWKGLYEFYLVEKTEKINGAWALDQFLPEVFHKTQTAEVFESPKHVLTHQDIYSFFLLTQIDDKQKTLLESEGNYSFYSTAEIADLPKPILIDKFLRQKIFD